MQVVEQADRALRKNKKKNKKKMPTADVKKHHFLMAGARPTNSNN